MFCFFFFNDTATTEIYTLSLHDALPIYGAVAEPVELPAHGAARRALDAGVDVRQEEALDVDLDGGPARRRALRSEEHTSELQSRQYLVCRLLLEKKKKTIT